MANHYLFIGLKPEDRDKRLAQLKTNLFTTPEAFQFDCEVLDGQKLDAKSMKAALYSLPAVAAKRLVIIRRAEKLTDPALEAVTLFLNDDISHVVLVLDAQSWDGRSGVKKNIREVLQPAIAAAPEREKTVFDMMDAVFAGSVAEGLRTLKVILDRGEKEEMLLGGMIWHWSNKVKGRIAADRYKKGLLFLQEADEHLKRSRFPEREQAIEVVLVKLSSLLRV